MPENADIIELCRGEKCGPCQLTGESYVVTDLPPSLQQGSEVGYAIYGTASESKDPRAAGLGAARLGRITVKIIASDYCTFTNPDGSVKNER